MLLVGAGFVSSSLSVSRELVESRAGGTVVIHEMILLEPGAVIAESLEIVRTLGSGSYGTVYEARDRAIANLRVAVKLFPEELARDRIAAHRLHREMRAAFQIRSPFVVQLFDVIRSPGLLGYTMEFVGGSTLDAYLKGYPAGVPFGRATAILSQLLEGLNVIHSHGFIHRDMKPANILLTPDGFAKIGDFGLIKSREHAWASQTRDLTRIDLGSCANFTKTGAVIGTPLYLSPEVIMGEAPDERSDLYALGVIAYQLFSGVIPYSFSSIPELFEGKVKGAIPPLTESAPEIPSAYAVFVGKLLDPDRRHRFSSAREASDELARLSIAFPELLNNTSAGVRDERTSRRARGRARSSLKGVAPIALLQREVAYCLELVAVSPLLQRISHRRNGQHRSSLAPLAEQPLIDALGRVEISEGVARVQRKDSSGDIKQFVMPAFDPPWKRGMPNSARRSFASLPLSFVQVALLLLAVPIILTLRGDQYKFAQEPPPLQVVVPKASGNGHGVTIHGGKVRFFNPKHRQSPYLTVAKESTAGGKRFAQ